MDSSAIGTSLWMPEWRSSRPSSPVRTKPPPPPRSRLARIFHAPLENPTERRVRAPGLQWLRSPACSPGAPTRHPSCETCGLGSPARLFPEAHPTPPSRGCFRPAQPRSQSEMAHGQGTGAVPRPFPCLARGKSADSPEQISAASLARPFCTDPPRSGRPRKSCSRSAILSGFKSV